MSVIAKRVSRVLLTVVILGTIMVAVLHRLSVRMPAGYSPRLLTDQQRAEAANRVDTVKIPQLLNLASDAQRSASATLKARAGQSVDPAATQPVQPLTVSFTQDEINASVWKWSERYRETYERYVTEPFISLEDGAIVLMGNLPDYGRVASAYFEPKLDDQGMLHCDLTSLKLGSLPLPGGLLNKQRAKIENALMTRLPAWQSRARIDATGATNEDARAAAMGKLVLQLLNNKPSPAVIFLPRDFHGSKTVPVRLTSVTIEKGALTITVQPMNEEERATLIEKIREPQQPSSAVPQQTSASAELPRN
jgi:hypothetical protein